MNRADSIVERLHVLLLSEEAEAERRERQRIWSRWLDEHIGPGCEIQLDGDEREELAAMLSRATYAMPERTANGWRERR